LFSISVYLFLFFTYNAALYTFRIHISYKRKPLHASIPFPRSVDYRERISRSARCEFSVVFPRGYPLAVAEELRPTETARKWITTARKIAQTRNRRPISLREPSPFRSFPLRYHYGSGPNSCRNARPHPPARPEKPSPVPSSATMHLSSWSATRRVSSPIPFDLG